MGIYRALLRLYPASFRREYGREMEAVFAARRAETRGSLPVLLLWLDTVAEILGNATMVHVDILRQDLRYVGRSLRRSPGFALTAVLVAALGIGANAAAFSVADFALRRPLPFPQPDRLVKLWQRVPGYSQMELSPANYRDWKAMSTSFQSMGAYWSTASNLVDAGEPERLDGTRMTPDAFAVLGVRAMLGRTPSAEEDRPGAAPVVVLSYALWHGRFAADPNILARSINLDGTAYQVIGVMPPEFQFPTPAVRFWTPFQLGEGDYADRGDNWLEVVADLRPGVSLDQARADMEVVAARLAEQYPDANEGTGSTVSPLRGEYSAQSRLLVLALAGASVCILVIACANLGSLLLARGLARQRELAVRTALGAGRDRLVRQLATESLILAGLGSLVGVLAALAAMPVMARLAPSSLPFAGGATLDLRMLAVAAVVTAVTCIVFAVLPARGTRGGGGFEALREGSRAGGGRKERLRGALVVVEVAASVVLLIAAGLLMRAIQRVNQVDPGFRVEGILTARTALPIPRYNPVAARQQFYTSVLTEVRALPGVTSAAYVSAVPLVWGGGIWPVIVNGEAEIRIGTNTASMRFVTPDYFATMAIPIRAGRDFAETDGQDGAFVAVVSESFVNRYWPGEDPLGKTFRMAFNDRRVVGVVADIMLRGLEGASEPQAYFPAPQVADGSLQGYAPKDLVVHGTGDMPSLVPAVRRAILAADPDQPVSNVRTMTEILSDQTASRATQLRVLATLAAIALLLAGIGIHGLLSYMVSQRTQEIGLRMALGAAGPALVRMVVGRGMRLVVAGLIPGIVIALLAGRAMQAMLFGVPPSDLLTFGIVVGLCLLTAVVGCLAPVWRAIQVDPIQALKAE